MILSDKTIQEYILEGKIQIFPPIEPTDIRPAGLRLHLGSDLLIPRDNQTVDLEEGKDVSFERKTIPESGYLLRPGQFILGTTHEKFQVPRDLVCQIDGRSTVARLGLAIHCVSGIIDGNYEEARCVVLEMKNLGTFNLLLRHKTAVAMLVFHQLTTPVQQSAQKQYQGQTGVMPPNLRLQKK